MTADLLRNVRRTRAKGMGKVQDSVLNGFSIFNSQFQGVQGLPFPQFRTYSIDFIK